MDEEDQHDYEAESKELEKLLLDIDCLDELDKWTNRLNVFDILSIKTNEIRHSNFLAWLLNPNETHGLGEYFLRKIIQSTIKNSPDYEQISLFDLDRMDLDDALVFREDNRIDLLVVSHNNKMILIIENKVYSKEHDDQLERYSEDVGERYPDYRVLKAYLTLFGDTPEEGEDWSPISYEFIHGILKTVLQNRELSNRCRIYIEDYLTVLGELLMNDEELKTICANIYERHGKALDIIYQNRPTRQSVLHDKLMELLKPYVDSKKIIMLKSTFSEIRFTTEAIRNKVGLFGDRTWLDTDDLLAFYIPTSSKNRYMVMTIGPGNQECRELWFDYFKGTVLFKCQFKDLKPKYKDIMTLRIKQKNLPDDEHIKKILASVKEFLDSLDKKEEIILAGPDYKPN